MNNIRIIGATGLVLILACGIFHYALPEWVNIGRILPWEDNGPNNGED
ncbi:MAG: hypothetical protein WC451_03575 [Patescibacteria group bacterium]